MSIFQETAGGIAQARASSRLLESILIRLTDAGLFLAIVFSGFRLRWTLFERRIPPVYADYTDGLIFLGDIFLALSCGAFALHLGLHHRRVDWGPVVLSLPLAGLMVTAAVSVVFSVEPVISLYHLGRLLLLAGMYLLLVNRRIRPARLVPAAAVGVAIQAGAGVGQWLAQADLGLQLLGEYELDPAWSGVSIVWSEAGRALRAYGLTDHPNILGGMLACSLLLILGWRIGEERRSRIMPLIDGVIFLGFWGLFVTFSRSAWLGLIVSLLLAALQLLLARSRRILLEGAAMLAAALILLAPVIQTSLPVLGVRMNAGSSFDEVPYEKSSIQERAVLNRTANEIFSENALTGVGVGAYVAALRSERPDYPFYYQPPHLSLLAAAVETGLFGALFYSLAVGAPLLLLLRVRKRTLPSRDTVIATSILAAIAIIGLFDYYPWLLAPGRFWHWLAWGLWATAIRRQGQNREE